MSPSSNDAVRGRDAAAFTDGGYSTAARISTDMVRLMSRYTGRGPTKARSVLNANFATVILDDSLTKAESNLVAAGEVEAILQQRRTFHRMMHDEAVAAVQEATGRRVRAYLSDLAPEAGVAAHVFVFEPAPETGETFVVEAGTDDAG